MSHLAHGRGGAGSDEHGVRPETEVNVRIPGAVALREELAHHGLVGECREGDRGDELLARRGDDHLHLGSPLNQSAYDEPQFIIGDLKKQSIQEVWNSSKAKELFCMHRKMFRKQSSCHNCKVLDFCNQKHRRCFVKIISYPSVMRPNEKPPAHTNCTSGISLATFTKSSTPLRVCT